MFRINCSQLSGFSKEDIADAIQSRHSIAILITIAAHFFLIYVVFTSPASIQESQQYAPFSKNSINVVNVNFVAPQAAASKPDRPDTSTVNLDDHKEKISEPMPDQAFSGESAPATKSRMVDKPLPPKPYYFRDGELGEKTKGEFGLPQELIAVLAGDAAHSAKLRLHINEGGEVDQVIIDESNFSEAEQQLLIDAFQKKKFEAGKIDGQAVKTEISLEIIVEK